MLFYVVVTHDEVSDVVDADVVVAVAAVVDDSDTADLVVVNADVVLHILKRCHSSFLSGSNWFVGHWMKRSRWKGWRTKPSSG